MQIEAQKKKSNLFNNLQTETRQASDHNQHAGLMMRPSI